jgi:hypothetical protein
VAFPTRSCATGRGLELHGPGLGVTDHRRPSAWQPHPGWQRRLWAPLALVAVIAVWSLFLPAGRAWHVQALTRAEFWLNRYQTLIAGLIALAGAWWTVRAMQRQTESVRSDAAERALTRYAVALQTVMQKYQAVRPPDRMKHLRPPTNVSRPLSRLLKIRP